MSEEADPSDEAAADEVTEADAGGASGSAPDPEGSRWRSPQPNMTGLGVTASYTPAFWGLVVLIGVLAGFGSGLLILLLNLVQHLVFGQWHSSTLLAAAERAAPWRRIAALIGAAIISVAGLAVIGSRPSGGTEVSEAIWLRSARMDWPRAVARGVLSIVTVGMGVSLGREAAPQAYGAATASQLAQWAKLPTWQRRLLVASGAGAGFAAVYNVPLGGALLALEVMLGTLALPMVLPALLCSAVATAVAWLLLGNHATYHVATYNFHFSQLVFALVLGPVIGLLGVGWTRLIRAAHELRPPIAVRRLAPFAVFGLLGVLSLQYPQLLGNGKSIVQLGIVANLSLGLLVMLLVLKPLATVACVATGSPGGLFTPTFAVGVLFAGVVGSLFTHVWGGSPAGSYTLIGGAAFLAAAMQGPLSGIVLVLELTRHFDQLIVPTVIAVIGATIVSRWLGASSIYSARLPSGEVHEAGGAAIAAIRALDETLPADIHRPPVG